MNLQAYFDYVESRPTNESVYLLTDNPETQRLFLDKYGKDKILVYTEISHINGSSSSVSSSVSSGFEGNRHHHRRHHHRHSKLHSNHTQLAEDFRYTTIEHTLIDILIAAHSADFKPAIYSSLSDLVRTFSNIGRNERGFCAH